MCIRDRFPSFAPLEANYTLTRNSFQGWFRLEVPADTVYQLSLVHISVKSAYAQADTSAQQTILVRASSLLADAQKALDELKKVTDAAETAKEYHDTVLPTMAALRAPIDELETIVDSSP